MGNSFLGRGWKFPVTVDPITGKILMSEAEEDIHESIRILLGTAKGERMMRPGYGCDLHRFVFDPTDPTTLHMIGSSIQEAIMQWEPRVHEVEVGVRVDPEAEGKLLLDVRYVVRSTNNLFNQVYPFYLYEGTN